MAHFKLYLLTPAAKNSFDGSFRFLKTIISEFYSQTLESQKEISFSKTNTFCYSFNEKLSIHTNGQKEFSFSMIKNHWLGDELVNNPFIKQIHNGSQLLLIDKYGNEIIFTVKNIAYKFGNQNITYDYSCQDSFTYQTIRQNDGYTIDNSIESTDFIGARTIDWWVTNKIQPECHLNYKYVPLFQGLFLDEDNNIQLYTEQSQLRKVKKIIKPAYNTKEYSDYYEAIPFVVSGSNCSAALISLGSEIGLMLNHLEHGIKQNGVDTHSFVRYFWYEPLKNEETANLKYSPHSSIQSLGLTQAADSLTTVLNIESHTIGEELITLIPDTPLFFKKLFLSSSWENTSFEPGYFSKICQCEILRSENSNGDFSYSASLNDDNYLETDEEGNKYLYIKITNRENDFQLPLYYSYVSFLAGDKESYCYINDKRYTPRSSEWSFIIKEQEVSKLQRSDVWVEHTYNDTYNPIPTTKLGKTHLTYVRIKLDDEEENVSLQTSLIILNFTRNTSAEELEFAKIADECPWLENKLIDFSYFLQQKIINSREYSELLNVVQNNLRIANGRLLSYTNEYYNALHAKTKTLARINETLDTLGATFNADIIDYYTQNGRVKDYTYFSNAYDAMIDAYFKGTSIDNELFNYNELLSEYFNKYFNAQQRFLKNIYNFKEYFNSPVDLPHNFVYRHNIVLKGIEEARKEVCSESKKEENKDKIFTYSYLSFNTLTYKNITSSFDLYDKQSYSPLVDIYTKDKQTIVEVVSKKGITNYYIATKPKGTIIPATGYNQNKTYYRILYKKQHTGGKIENYITLSFTNNRSLNCTLHHIDNGFLYYGFRESDYKTITSFGAFDYETLPDTDSTSQYKKELESVSFKEIIAEYLLRQHEEGNTSSWFYHNLDTSSSTKNWKYYYDKDHQNIQSLIDNLSPLVWTGALTSEDENNTIWDPIYNEAHEQNSVESEIYQQTVRKLYFDKFPVTAVYYVGPKYKKTSLQWYINGSSYSPIYERINKKSQTISEYIDWWRRVQLGEVLDEVKNPTTYTEKQTITLIKPSNESSYYRKVVADPFWGYAAGVASGVLTSVCGGLIGGVNGVIAGATIGATTGSLIANWVWKVSDTAWATSGKNTRIANDEVMDVIYSGYSDNRSISNFEPANIRINYTVGQDSYQTYLDLQNNRKANDFIRTITEKDSNYKKDDLTTPPIQKAGESFTYTTETCLAKIGDKQLVSTNLTNRKDYFDYYSLFGFTYHDVVRENNSNITYNESFLRPLALNSYVNPKFKYKLLIQKNDVSESLIFKTNNFNLDDWLTPDSNNISRLNKIVYYPLSNSVIDIDFSVLNWKENVQSMTLKEALIQAGYSIANTNDNDKWISADGRLFMVFQDENFNRTRTILDSYFDLDGYIKKEHRFSLFDGRTIENIDNATEVNFYTAKNLLQGFFEASEQDSDHKQIEEDTEIVWEDFTEEDTHIFVESTKFYKKENNDYIRVYSIFQLKQMGGYSYLDGGTYSIENFDQQPETLNCPMYLHTDSFKNGELISSIVKTIDTLVNCGYDNSQPKNETDEGLIFIRDWEDANTKLSYSYLITSSQVASIKDMTNGEFWYTYHSRMEVPTLYQRAILIASDLTMYWDQAYSASKYCEYFLPETWQLNQNGKTNFFINNIFTIIPEENKEDLVVYKLKLLNTFLPDVQIFSTGKTTQLPRYTIRHIDNYTYTKDTVDKEINKINLQPAKTALRYNKVFYNACAEIGESLENLYVEYVDSDKTTNKTTYYYADTGGTKWNNIISKVVSGSPQFNEFNGLHIMMYKILKTYYRDQPLTNYYNALKEHNVIWDSLYRNFPGLILEKVYSNSAATSSNDLYLLGKNAFRDMSYPENGYTLSLIDTDNLKGYEGQELHIGDGILVDAEEFDEDNQNIKQALSQYLFITDISYNLRKDSDVSLTVNSIKYQDKLIQRLVKLIK